MKKSALGLFALVVLIGGCADSASDNAPAGQSTSADPSEQVEDASSINASTLLTSTLEKAKAENKRVMVHLGAPG